MTIEEDFFAAATAGSPSLRLYPEVLPPEGAILPAGTFTVIGGSDDLHMGGQSNTGFRMVQLDTWASSRLSADSLMDDFQSRLMQATAFLVVAIDVSGAPRYEPETQRYRASKEFTIRFD